jgi:hypothetical protein
MTPVLRRVFFLFLFSLLTACNAIIGAHDINYPLSKLQASLDKKFPLNNRYLELLDVQLNRPALSLMPAQGRIACTLQFSVGPLLLGKKWQGAVNISAVPGIDMQQSAIVLDDLRIEQIQMDGINDSAAPQLRKALNFMVEQRLQHLAIHHFQPEDFSYAGIRFVPTKITPTENSLVVSFEPAK